MAKAAATSTTLPAVITFEGVDIDITDRAGRPWVRGLQIASALGFRNPSSDIANLYERNKDEFTDAETALVDLPTQGGLQKVRLFSARGAWLIGMLAKTEKAKRFRRWVLDVLERETETKPVQVREHRRRVPAPVHGDLERRVAFMEAQIKMLAAGAVTERELYGIVMNANVRTEKHEEPDFAKSIENVMADRVTRSSGGTPSGKTLLLLEKDYGKTKPAMSPRQPWRPESQWPSHPHVWERQFPDGASPMIDTLKKSEKLPDGSIALPVVGGGYTILPPTGRHA